MRTMHDIDMQLKDANSSTTHTKVGVVHTKNFKNKCISSRQKQTARLKETLKIELHNFFGISCLHKSLCAMAVVSP
jgi:hypothetical protein